MSTELMEPSKIAKAKKLIYIVSIVVPIAVAALFSVEIKNVDLSVLPPEQSERHQCPSPAQETAALYIMGKNGPTRA